MDFKDIPIAIGGRTVVFDFEYRELTDYGQACFIRSGKHELIVDEDFSIIKNDFPEEWVASIITELKRRLHYKE